MKIKPEDLECLREWIVPFDTPARRIEYKERKLSSMRYRWDLLYLSRIKIGDGIGTKGNVNLYAYLTDGHIDSALKAIVPDLVPDYKGGPT